MTPTEIRRAVDATRDFPWPPVPAEFRAAGKPQTAENAAMYRTVRALPRPKPTEEDIESGRETLQALRDLCRGGRKSAAAGKDSPK